MYTLEEPFLNVNCAHVAQFDADLYRQLKCYPQEVIPTFDMAANEMFFEKYPDSQLPHQIQVRPFNSEKTQSMRSLNPEGKYFSSSRVGSFTKAFKKHIILQQYCHFKVKCELGSLHLLHFSPLCSTREGI